MRPTLLLATLRRRARDHRICLRRRQSLRRHRGPVRPRDDAGADARRRHRLRRGRRRRPERDRRARRRSELRRLRRARQLEALRHEPLRRHADRRRPPRRPARRRARRRSRRRIELRPGRPMARALPVGRRPDERPARVAPHERRPLDRRRGDRLGRGREPPRAAGRGRQVARRQLHPLRRPEGALRPRLHRPLGPARLPRRRLRGPRHLGREPHRRRAERLCLERRRARRPDRLLQGARGRPRRALDVDPLRPRRRVLRPAHRRREHVDRGATSIRRIRLPSTTTCSSPTPSTTASRAACRSSRPRATPTSAWIA